MKRAFILIILLSVFTLQSCKSSDYTSFKSYFNDVGKRDSGKRIPNNAFTSFLYEDRPESKIYGCIKIAYPNGYELFILRQVIEMDDEEYEYYNIDRTFYLVFRDEQLVENYNSESTKNTLDTEIINDGGYFLSQSYSIDKDNSIVIDKDLSECCSSSGFEEPIRTKTKVRYRLDNNGSLKATEVLKMELTSNLFDEEFLANYTRKYPTLEEPYRFFIDDDTQYFPLGNDSIDIRFQIRHNYGQLYPEINYFGYYPQDKLMNLPITITIPNKSSQTLYEEIQHQRKRRDERSKIYWEKEEKAEIARYEALPFITPKEIAAIRPVIAK